MALHRIDLPHQRCRAEIFHRTVGRGRNKAILITVREGETAVDCFVKLSARLTMPPQEHLLEWYANGVGQALGLDVGVPIVVDLDADFARSITDADARRDALNSLGPQFGSRQVVGLTQVADGLSLSGELKIKASELLAFDVMIHNWDRRRGNPNLFVGRNRIFAFDHGDAFAFLLPVIGGTTVDPAEDPLLSIVPQHVFGESLRGNLADLTDFRTALAALTDADLAGIAAAAPPEWVSGRTATTATKIQDVMKGRRDRVGTWLRDLELWVNR